MTTASTERGLDSATLAELHESLLAARRATLQTFGVTEEDLRCIEEDRQSELEERGQDEAASEVLSRLEVHEYRRLREIQSALDRISDGSYGRCATCNGEIARERLLAMPEALLCAECATTAEGNWARKLAAQTAREEPVRRLRPMPPDLGHLSDAEVAQAVRERLRTEVGEALYTVHVAYQGGVVTLWGEVASPELGEVASRIIEEEIGLEVVDRLRTTEAAGDRPRPPEDIMEAAVENGESVEDVFATAEEGGDYTPPARPVAESE